MGSAAFSARLVRADRHLDAGCGRLGANTAIFSAVYAVLLKPLPFPNSQRLVWLGENVPQGRRSSCYVAELPILEDREPLLRGHGRFSDRRLHAHWPRPGCPDPCRRGYQPVFRAYRLARPARAAVRCSRRRSPCAPVVLVNEAFWAKTLGADPQIVGKTLTLDGTSLRDHRRSSSRPAVLSSARRTITFLIARRLPSSQNAGPRIHARAGTA